MSATSIHRAFWANSGAGLRGFLAWWGRSLAAWLPARMRHALCDDHRLLLQLDGDVLRLWRQHGDDVLALAELPVPLPADPDPLARLLREDARDWARWLRLPAGAGLRRRLVLPAAARERLRDVLAFEIERQTPFAQADVLHDGRILQVREDGQLLVELVVLPRRRLDALLAPLGGAGGRLAGVDMLDEAGTPLGINLLPPAGRRAAAD